jgi:hypothetical protein
MLLRSLKKYKISVHGTYRTCSTICSTSSDYIKMNLKRDFDSDELFLRVSNSRRMHDWLMQIIIQIRVEVIILQKSYSE